MTNYQLTGEEINCLFGDLEKLSTNKLREVIANQNREMKGYCPRKDLEELTR